MMIDAQQRVARAPSGAQDAPPDAIPDAFLDQREVEDAAVPVDRLVEIANGQIQVTETYFNGRRVFSAV